MKKSFLFTILIMMSFLFGCTSTKQTTSPPKTRLEIQMMAHQQQSEQKVVDTNNISQTFYDEYQNYQSGGNQPYENITINIIEPTPYYNWSPYFYFGYSFEYYYYPYYPYYYDYPYYYGYRYPYYFGYPYWGWNRYYHHNYHGHYGHYYGPRNGYNYNRIQNPTPKPNTRQINPNSRQTNPRYSQPNQRNTQPNPRYTRPNTRQTNPNYVQPRNEKSYYPPSYRQPRNSQEYVSPRTINVVQPRSNPPTQRNYSAPVQRSTPNYSQPRSTPPQRNYSAPVQRNTPNYSQPNSSPQPRSNPPSSSPSRSGGGRR